MAELVERIQGDITAAMKARDSRTLGVLRMLSADLKNEAIARRRELTDDEAVQVLTRAVKQRREAAEQFTQGGRQDLVDKETWEAGVVERYLPTPLTEAELVALVDAAIAELPAGANLGQVMRVLMPKVQGRADGKRVNAMVRARLA
ncbi:MAG: GatB/YqeY domain-containing protein [Nitrospirota bacterium]|jgi:uncharacterized protein YqeY